MKSKIPLPPILFLLVIVFMLTACQPAAAPSPAEDISWGEIELSLEETEWLETHQTVQIAYDLYPPFLLTERDNFTGIGFDTLNILLNKVGLTPEYINTNLAVALEKMQNDNDLDMISLVGSTPEREKYLEFTEDIINYPNVIFTQKNASFIGDISDLRNKTIAVENRFRVHDDLKADYPEINLLVVNTTQEALTAVSTSQADAYIGNLAVGSYMIQEYGLINLKVAAPSPFKNQNLAIGIRKDQTELASILNKALAAMPEEAKNQIRQEWLTVTYEYGISEKDVWIRIATTSLVAILILGIVIYANARLASEIEKTGKAQLALKNSEKLLRHVLNASPAAIFLVDKAGKFIFANQEAANQYGKTVEEMIGKTRFEFIQSDDNLHTKDYSRFHAEDLQVIETQQQIVLSKDPFTMPDGSFCWFETMKTPVTIQDGRDCVLVITRDLTEQYETAAALEESEKLLRRVMDASPTAIFLIDEEGKFIFANQTTAEIFSTDLENMIGKTRFELSYNSKENIEAFKTYEQEDQEVIASQQPKRIEKECFTFPDGSVRWFQTFKTPLNLQNGRKCVLVVALDITARRKIESALEESEKQLRAVIDATPDVIFVKDRDGNFLLVNQMAAALYDMTPEELEGLSERKLARLKSLPEEQIEHYMKTDRLTIEQQTPISLHEEQLRRPGKPVLWFLTRKIPLETQGKTNKVLVVGTNITERKIAMEALKKERASLAQRVEERTAELVRLNIELQESSRAKDEFLANMSHELRTPLNAILGMSEILEEQLFGDLNEKQLKHVTIIEESGKHLLTLINDILDLSKIESGESNLTYQPVNVADLCESSLNFIKQQALKKKLSISYDPTANLGAVEGDPRSLKQILVNLLSNAVKFTPEGGHIGLTVVRDEEQETIHMTVWDDGIGITPQQGLKLFRPFVQIDSSLSRNYEGTGLGLALISRLVDIHGGSISLESSGIDGEGSRFIVQLPFHLSKIQKNQTHSEFENRRILLLDDEPNSTLRIKTILNNLGCRVFVSQTKQEIIQMLQTIQPDVIILDLQIPQETNIATIHQIRQTLDDDTIPIFSMTSLMIQKSSILSNSLGTNENLLKPVSPIKLKELLKKHLQKG